MRSSRLLKTRKTNTGHTWTIESEVDGRTRGEGLDGVRDVLEQSNEEDLLVVRAGEVIQQVVEVEEEVIRPQFRHLPHRLR